jgi:putative transposase
VSRYRLQLTHDQEAILQTHCAHARFVWNLACEQQLHWRPGRHAAPGLAEQCRQLSEARRAFDWLAAGSAVVQQQALRDFAQAMAKFRHGTHGRPSWRKAGRRAGFRIVGVKPEHIRRLNANVGAVYIPKAGWVRFRWSRLVPAAAKSYRVTLDPAGRWHIGFAVIPEPIQGPGTGEIVGIDRGIAVSAALSTGELLSMPRLSLAQRRRLRQLTRKLSRAKRGSRRREVARKRAARLHGKQTDMRRDWSEKTSTAIAHRFDVIRIEDLNIRNMTRSARGGLEKPGRNVEQKSGMNREILASGWGRLARRLEDKAPGRVQKVKAAYTSQRCSACGYVAAESRKNQAIFACVSCRYACNADVNAARNIAAGHAVTARGGLRDAGPGNREPQLDLSPT